ncbi:MAG: CPBP family intramembrane metalloprotease [Phycisphaerales bacterium]|nr:CPBP family intramembrane metalloprotease [Phycisphaerales bacterium]
MAAPKTLEAPGDYFGRSRQPLTMLLVLLPVIAIVEFGLGGASSSDAQQVLANVQLREVVRLFAISPVVVVHALGVIVLLVLITWHALDQRPWKIRPADIPLMLLEGCIASVPLLVAAAALLSTSHLPLTAPEVETFTLPQAILVACTAALSEEFIFRMCGIALGHLILVDLLRLKDGIGLTVSVIATAAAFTLYHDPAGLGPLPVTFYAVAGLYLGGLFVARGFAPAVLAHAIYNVIALS